MYLIQTSINQTIYTHQSNIIKYLQPNTIKQKKSSKHNKKQLSKTITYLSSKQASKLNQKLIIIDKNHQSNQLKTSDLLVSFDITCWAC